MLLYQRMEHQDLAATTFHVCTPTICTATGSTLGGTGFHTRTFPMRRTLAQYIGKKRHVMTRDALWYKSPELTLN